MEQEEEGAPEKQRTKRSLRRQFFVRSILFTLLPLTILAVVVQNQYKATINKQIKNRLTVHVREIEALFTKERNSLENFLSFTVGDKSLTYYLSTLDVEQVKDTIREKLRAYASDHVKVYTYAGQPFVFYNKEFLSIHGQESLSRDLMKSLEATSELNRVQFWKEGGETLLMLSEIRRIVGFQGKTVGYVEALLPVDKVHLKKLTKLTGAEIVFFNRQGEVLLGSLPNPVITAKLSQKFLMGHNSFFEFDLASEPFAFISAKLAWGSKKFLLGVGSSTAEAAQSIRKVNYVIIFTYVCFLIFFLLMSYFFLVEFIHPIESLIKASEKMKESREAVYIKNESRTEVADLIDSFNGMSQQIHQSDAKLKKQLELLETANSKIQRTQGQLVQSAKLASLGELVAGIAHELNNPIGFIYSNIDHLKQYSKSLIELVDLASSKDEAGFLNKKDEDDFDYIKKDLPKLIHSCEEGAVRAKEIVLGLRNFSRADDKTTQAFDVNEGVESTLKLLGGQLKNRIQVVKNFGKLPSIQCNANQIKQVFMNILSNSAQAIPNTGVISISTESIPEKETIELRIRDTGPGIPQEVLEKIFDPFFTTKKVGEGTGLGLSISYGIVTSHGGEILVASTEGEGTEFRVILPVRGPAPLKI